MAYKIIPDKRSTRPLKFDDRPGMVTEQGRRYGISEHKPSVGNARFIDQCRKSPPSAVCYVAQIADVQLMANSRPFFVEQTTLRNARDNHLWIVGVEMGGGKTPGQGIEGSHRVDIMAEAYRKGTEVPASRWAHNAYRIED